MSTVVAALSAVMAEVTHVGKGDLNPDQGYRFRGIDAVVNAVGPALRRHGVLVIPKVLEVNHRDVRTSRDKPARECTVRVRYRFYGPEGDYLDCVTPGESMDFGDKGAAKAMSVAYRIALLQALCLPTDEPDPDVSTYERAEPEPATPTAVPNSGDLRTRVLAQDVTPDQLGAMFSEAARAGNLDVPTMDGHGRPITVRDLINDRRAALVATSNGGTRR